MIGEWPLQDSLELGALPDAVPCARLHTRQILWEWGLTWLSENAELIVSELLTNAVNAARSRGSIGPVRLWLLSDWTQLLILVWDGNPLPPVRVLSSEQTESGRGLMLVETLARQWDWYAPVNTGGKVVWALLLQDPRR
jgi:anti-sigma regulatory factor (Ser/Thr protein kinase)